MVTLMLPKCTYQFHRPNLRAVAPQYNKEPPEQIAKLAIGAMPGIIGNPPKYAVSTPPSRHCYDEAAE
jgi:hypothetical protein